MTHKSENKICQNCKEDFTIEPDDFGFYEKIKVPPPTFCPECRLVRRMISTNERVLYKRKCDLTGKDIFSMYEAGAKFPVYETDAWYSDGWDAYSYGMEYNENHSFFEQYLELQNKVPRMALVRQGMSVNSPYTHRLTSPKNCYMVFRATYPENSFYSYVVTKLMNSSDCIFSSDSELCYECINCEYCYNTKFCQESKYCRDSYFLYACRNCSNCVGCMNLVNQEYCIWNEKYTKEEYLEKLKELKLNSFSGISKMEKEFSLFKKKFPKKAIASIKSENVSGNWFSNSKNVYKSFDCLNVKDGKYLFGVFGAEDCMDYFEWGNKAELIYESENCGIDVSRLSFCTQCWMGASDLYYCNTCPGARNCFGCVGLKKGEYSILNKKYSKEEYEILKEKIIKQMSVTPYFDGKLEYRYGEAFPNSFSDFAYNESAAGDFFPLTKKEVLSRGYRWKDREKKNYETTIKSGELPETIGEVDDSILKEVIECGEKDSPNSVGAFRITENELSFYRRMDLPLPRVCFDIRHLRRLNKRPMLRLQKRDCSKCNVAVETVYTKEYSPIIYCETCYQQEVY
ncbi:hypothetical protein A3A05_02875 [Candidatus Nomurabacteria bacterium RIFCSPLOWO2_01_FULL_41_12]|uniref:Uncharacterized protein n=1 Tax=Candidatus Nomurabacteria bacterium RIFCSPLOWO2_01_FULL_41_12 TaxID=1801774 RepID=A0A1F6WX80_9BACT|nr:MAG: hypothetical protein A2732_02780 [Candidatus Nomurabacteria bacterium RIFCSPHIGHO2_01_FULL_40_10]OGI86470.1 MAG: hypothetical protein A3A05_02875 [Candidatus Nomurabacteria bacterium RIFCSPLOWO2_01_FULL_41_12]